MCFEVEASCDYNLLRLRSNTAPEGDARHKMLEIRNRYDDEMTDPGIDPGTGEVRGLDDAELDTYFALMEAVSLLQHRVEQQLHAEGQISYVQFQLLARLAAARGQLTMTELADGVVYSRSGLTYQAGLLERAGLITRGPSPDDDRATLVTITDSGRAMLGQVMPGHIAVVRQLLLQPLSDGDVGQLGDIMTRVRDHMRAQPPRSAASRKRHPASTSPDAAATQATNA
jgi:DNA-binding MarR family transcriptional regulator